MPSTSKAQRRATAIAEHHPEQLHARNRGMLKMTQRQLHDFASTREKGLPKHAGGKHATKRTGKRSPMPMHMAGGGNRYNRLRRA